MKSSLLLLAPFIDKGLMNHPNQIKKKYAGPLTLLNITREKYWPINRKHIASKHFRNCVICTKTKPQNIY